MIRTVRQRMEDLDWHLTVCDDTLAVVWLQIRGGRVVGYSSSDAAFQDDLERCTTDAERAGDLVNV
ncbi:MAG TPA: hypothetical protein VNW90_10795 [Acetobacteraceae bacterium]|jgi:hypothetical protein|nr:hypothetical protein [Acetobacteraceae bacterium]